MEINDLKKITLPVVEAARGSLVIETARHIVTRRRTIWFTPESGFLGGCPRFLLIMPRQSRRGRMIF